MNARHTIRLTGASARNAEVRLSRAVNLEFGAGEHIAIVGPNAAGKSLLADILVGKTALQEGRIEYDFYPSRVREVYKNIRYIAFRDTYGSSDTNCYYQRRWNSTDHEEIPAVRELLGECRASALQQRLFRLFQMEELCREMAARGLSTPLLVGGATTSALHTAVKLAPLYPHVFHAADASSCAVAAQRCLSDRVAFEAREHAAQAELRRLHGRKQAPEHALPRPHFAPASFPRGEVLADCAARSLPLSALRPLFDWQLFRMTAGIRGDGPEAQALLAEGQALLDRMEAEGGLTVRLSLRMGTGCSDGTAIRFRSAAGEVRLPMLRQEEAPGASLCDFLPDESLGFCSPMGVFALSVRPAHREDCACPACREDALLERAVRVGLAEAASAFLAQECRKRLPEGVQAGLPGIGYACCPDHSLKGDVAALLPAFGELGIRFSESYAMLPDASVCGLLLLHPDFFYPDIRRIGKAQYEAYAAARGWDAERARMFLGHLL